MRNGRYSGNTRLDNLAGAVVVGLWLLTFPAAWRAYRFYRDGLW